MIASGKIGVDAVSGYERTRQCDLGKEFVGVDQRYVYIKINDNRCQGTRKFSPFDFEFNLRIFPFTTISNILNYFTLRASPSHLQKNL